MQAQAMIKPDFISEDGRAIYLETLVADSSPPMISHYIKVGSEPRRKIEWYNIHQTLRETYGVPEKSIPERYKPVPLLQHNDDQSCCILSFLRYLF